MNSYLRNSILMFVYLLIKDFLKGGLYTPAYLLSEDFLLRSLVPDIFFAGFMYFFFRKLLQAEPTHGHISGRKLVQSLFAIFLLLIVIDFSLNAGGALAYFSSKVFYLQSLLPACVFIFMLWLMGRLNGRNLKAEK